MAYGKHMGEVYKHRKYHDTFLKVMSTARKRRRKNQKPCESSGKKIG